MERRMAKYEDEEIARAFGVKIEDVIFKLAQAIDLRFDSTPLRLIARDQACQSRKQIRPDLPSAADDHDRRRDERSYYGERGAGGRPYGFVPAETGQRRGHPRHPPQAARNR